MESITLGQIASAIALLGGLITGASLIVKNLKKWLEAALTEKFNGIDTRLDDLGDSISEMKQASCMDYLVSYLNDVSNGQVMDEVAQKRFWEQYDYYTTHGGNSYIREKVNKLKERGLL